MGCERFLCCVVPGDPSLFGGSLLPNAALIQPPSQQATRHARRVYVGGLPPTANEQSIATFFSHALAAVGGTSSGPGVVGKSCCHLASQDILNRHNEVRCCAQRI